VIAVDASPVAAAPETEPTADKRDDKTPVKTTRGKGAGREEALSPTLLADLGAGERALAAKDAGEAIRLARHSLYEKKTARAASIMTRAFCLQHDLGAAKAELVHVAASDRARVLRACRAAGMDL
jgi:serine/threonine-protein kinase